MMSNIVSVINRIVCGLNLNILLLSSNALGFILGPARLMAIITIIVIRKDSPMHMWNGITKISLPLSLKV